MSERDALLARDDRARRLARTEFARPVVLEAGAGTGKTSALVARVSCWSLTEGWARSEAALAAAGAPVTRARIAERALGRVAAITFTELAAAEMQERVGRALARLASWDGTSAEPVLGLRVADLGAVARDPAEIRARARALSDAEDALVVSTIHSFAGRILSEHAVAAGIHPGYAVDAEGGAARAAADEVLAEELPRALGERGDADWEVLLEREIGPARLREALLALLGSGEDPELLAGDPLAPGRVAAERAWTQGWLAQVLALLVPAFGDRQGLARSPSTLPAFDALIELGGVLRAPADVDAFLAALRAPALEGALAKLREWSKKGANQTERKKLGADADALQRVADEGATRLEHLVSVDPAVLRPAWRVLHALWSRARAKLDAAGVLSFQDLLARAAALLRRDAIVRRAVQGGIDQLLIDEFQDTDPLQYEIAGTLALPDGSDAPLPGLFLVGDPKQSIYAWRGADLAAYEAFLARVLAAGGERASLIRNFRSSQAVLDEVERLVAPSMVHEPGLQPAFEPLIEARDPARGSPAWISAAPRGPIEHWISWQLDASDGRPPWKTPSDAAREIEARAIARDLSGLAERGLGTEPKWSDVAILLRTTTGQETYLEALREAGIPCTVERDRNYYQSREIEDAVSLVTCVLAPSDALSLAAALRTSVVGAPDAALEPLFARGLPDLCARLDGPDAAVLAELERAVDAVARELAADEELQRECGLARIPRWPVALRELFHALGELRASFASESADLFVARLRARLLFEETESARWLGPHRQKKLERFFRELVQALAQSAGGPDAVLRELAARLEGERDPAHAPGAHEGENAVRLLSIHKAKGLEFGLVYLADLHHQEKRDNTREFRHARVRAADGAARLELDLFGSPSLGWGAAKERADAAAERENARLLYVATTRAKDRLVLAGCWPEPGKGKAQAPLLDLVLDRKVPPPDLAALAAKATSAESSASEIHGDALWVLPAALPAAAAASSVGGEAVAFDVDGARSEAERVLAARADAAARAALPLAETATAAGGDAEIPAASVAGRSERSGLPRHVARAVGTAVHRALEEHDGSADPAAELARVQRIAARSLATQLEDSDLAAANTAASDLLARFLGSPLGAELRALGSAVVGREVPVLLASGGGSPTATIGSIDLLYRAGADRSLVVADFKTDALGATEPGDQITRTYGPQLRAYARAATTALGTPCRSELLLVDPCVRASVDGTAD